MSSFIGLVEEKLVARGFICNLSSDALSVQIPDVLSPGGQPVHNLVRPDPDLELAYQAYLRLRSSQFSPTSRTLIANNSFEIALVRLDASFGPRREALTFTSARGETVEVGPASLMFSFAYFHSSDYDTLFERRYVPRFQRRAYMANMLKDLLPAPSTARYNAPGRKQPANLAQIARQKIEGCIFKMAVETEVCYQLFDPKTMNPRQAEVARETDRTIPHAAYEREAVAFYKVARASPFPSQAYLAYYHVLEYYFQRVVERKMHDQLAVLLNDVNFRAEKKSLDKLIALIKGQEKRNDETEMLRAVIANYVIEDDLIGFVKEYETSIGANPFSKKRKAFGKELQVAAHRDQAIGTAARTIKDIRNAIVHSSDNYKRDDCHIPLSETELLIDDYIPLIKFLAEKVIYGSAE